MQTLQFEPSLVAGHTIAGVLYRKLGAPQQAEAHATRAVELQPTRAEAVEMRGKQQPLMGGYVTRSKHTAVPRRVAPDAAL